MSRAGIEPAIYRLRASGLRTAYVRNILFQLYREMQILARCSQSYPTNCGVRMPKARLRVVKAEKTQKFPPSSKWIHVYMCAKLPTQFMAHHELLLPRVRVLSQSLVR